MITKTISNGAPRLCLGRVRKKIFYSLPVNLLKNANLLVSGDDNATERE